MGQEARDVGDLYEREGAGLWRAVYAYCQDRSVTDDAVAEAFAQCLRRGDAVRDQRAWVWTAAFRLAAGDLQRRGTLLPIEDRPYPGPGVDAVAILEALRALPGNQRAVAVLRFYADLPSAQIAELLGMSRATVRVHLSRARRRLQTLLTEGDET